jgi:endonuclease-3
MNAKYLDSSVKKNIIEIINGVKQAISSKNVHWHAGMNTFQMLVGTVLSQRTKDANTEKAAKQLFSTYKTAEQIANAPISEIRKLIKPSGFYKVKAKHIQKLCKILVEKYNGKVPKNREELMQLPGVGAKTSGIVMVYGFRIPTSIPVDIHVFRISNRIGLVKTKTPEQTEIELMKIIPKKNWIELNELFVIFGQNICIARNPHCWECPITKYCNYYKNVYLKNKRNQPI